MAYNAGDIISAVKDDLKDPSFSSTRLLRYLNRGQELVFATHQLKHSETAVTGALTIGEYTFEQQDDHEATIGGTLVDPDNSNIYLTLNEKNYLPHRQFFEQYPNPDGNDNAMPLHWTEYGDQYYFNCPVDKAYLFTQRYHRMPAELDADADVPDIPRTHRDLLETYMLYRSEKYRGNHDIAATYRQDFEDGLEAMALKYAPVIDAAFPTMTSVRERVEW